MGQGIVITKEQLKRMDQSEKIREIRNMEIQMTACFNSEVPNHHNEISHHAWEDVIVPLEVTYRSLALVLKSLIHDIENPPAEAPTNPPAPPAGGIDPSDLSQGWTPPAGNGDEGQGGQ